MSQVHRLLKHYVSGMCLKGRLYKGEALVSPTPDKSPALEKVCLDTVAANDQLLHHIMSHDPGPERTVIKTALMEADTQSEHGLSGCGRIRPLLAEDEASELHV